MPAQVQKTGLLAGLGQQMTNTMNEQRGKAHKDVSGQLPPGINGATAALKTLTIGEYKEGTDTKGKPFFMASGVCVYPETFTDANGQVHTIAGGRTQVGPIPLCNTPNAQGEKKTFAQHWADFRDTLFHLGLDIDQFSGTPQQVEAQILAGMQALLAQKIYFKFETWSGKPTPQFPNPKTNHKWLKACEYNPNVDVGGGVTLAPSTNGPSSADLVPDQGGVHLPPQTATASNGEVVTAGDIDLMVLAALANTSGDAAEASANHLKELAIESGIEQSVIDDPEITWDQLATQILEAQGGEGTEESAPPEPKKGEVWVYAFKDKNKKDVKKQVNIESVDSAKRVCDVKRLDTKVVLKGVSFDALTPPE